jgi:hypothetical protein
LEELNLFDAVFSFIFFVFFLVGGAKFSLAASEYVVIVEVLASVPEPSCSTYPERRELRLVADGVEMTEAAGASGWGGMEGVSATAMVLTLFSFRWRPVASFSCWSMVAAIASSSFLRFSASFNLIGIVKAVLEGERGDVAAVLSLAGWGWCWLVEFALVSVRIAMGRKILFTSWDRVSLDAPWACGWGLIPLDDGWDVLVEMHVERARRMRNMSSFMVFAGGWRWVLISFSGR